jgi:hypothetical protein
VTGLKLGQVTGYPDRAFLVSSALLGKLWDITSNCDTANLIFLLRWFSNWVQDPLFGDGGPQDLNFCHYSIEPKEYKNIQYIYTIMECLTDVSPLLPVMI